MPPDKNLSLGERARQHPRLLALAVLILMFAVISLLLSAGYAPTLVYKSF